MRFSARFPAALPLAELMALPLTQAKEQLLASFERTRIEAALQKHNGNISAAARELGIHRQNLQQKLTQLGMKR